MRSIVVAGVVLVATSSLAGTGQESTIPDVRATKVVDLGHPLLESDPTFGGKPVFTHTPVGSVEKDGVLMGRFASDEHNGTHLDAPAHFAASGWTVDQIPAARLVRPGACINIEKQSAGNDDYQLQLEDIKADEARHGAIPEGALVLVASGWDRRWPDAARYRNARDGVLHFPGLSVPAAEYLVATRKVAGIAIDTPSVDHGPSKVFEVHRATMPHNVYHVENAARLTMLPARGFTVVVAPINIARGSGAPTRVFALLP